MMVTRGYYIKVEMRGHTPQHKKEMVCRARHGLTAPCQRVVTELEAGWGTWERLQRVFAYTPFGLKSLSLIHI